MRRDGGKARARSSVVGPTARCLPCPSHYAKPTGCRSIPLHLSLEMDLMGRAVRLISSKQMLTSRFLVPFGGRILEADAACPLFVVQESWTGVDVGCRASTRRWGGAHALYRRPHRLHPSAWSLLPNVALLFPPSCTPLTPLHCRPHPVSSVRRAASVAAAHRPPVSAWHGVRRRRRLPPSPTGNDGVRVAWRRRRGWPWLPPRRVTGCSGSARTPCRRRQSTRSPPSRACR